MKTLTLLILLNAADGSQTVQGSLAHLDEVACLAMQAQIWAAAETSPRMYMDENGWVHQLDAACVYDERSNKIDRGVHYSVYKDRQSE